MEREQAMIRPVWQHMCSKEYADSVEAHNKAHRIYRNHLEKFRKGEISDADFIIARNAVKMADRLFDAAYDRESKRQYEGIEA